LVDELYSILRIFADNMLRYGRDDFSPSRTMMFVNSVDTDALKPEGVVNLLEYQKGLSFLYDLYLLTGEPRYLEAVRNSEAGLFKYCRFPQTGLLAWGEKMRYDVMKGSWAPSDPEKPEPIHQFCEPFPAVAVMAKTGFLPELTEYAESVWKYHVYNKAEYAGYADAVNADTGEIADHTQGSYHGAQLIYMLAYLYHATGQRDYAGRALQLALYPYSMREKNTGLISLRIDVKRNQVLGETVYPYVTKYYWALIYGYRWTGNPEFLQLARDVVQAYVKYGFDWDRGVIYQDLRLDGATPERKPFRYYTWDTAAIAVKLWELTGDLAFLKMARCTADHVTDTKTFDWGGFPYSHYEARVLHLYLELHRATGEKRYLKMADERAKLVLEHYLSNGFITNAPVGVPPERSHMDVAYTNQGATHGTHELASQLLRLYLVREECNIVTFNHEGTG